MKFMVMHKHDKSTEAGTPPPPALIAAMGSLVGGMAESGKLLDGDGLGASRTRSRITFKEGSQSEERSRTRLPRAPWVKYAPRSGEGCAG